VRLGDASIHADRTVLGQAGRNDKDELYEYFVKWKYPGYVFCQI
jgi:hypothetical protein